MVTTENTARLREAGIDPENFSLDDHKRILAKAMQEIPSPKERIDLIRRFLQVVAAVNPDFVEGLFGISVVERSQDRPSPESCLEYVIGHDTDPFQFHETMLTTYEQSRNPTPGAIALYVDETMQPLHMGKVANDNSVVSKWGLEGHVYKHHPLLVPIGYGDHVVYFSPPPQAE